MNISDARSIEGEGGHTITGNNKEFIVIGQLVHCHIGVGSHDLLFGRQFGTLLELKVTNGTGQSEVAVYTAKVDEAAGGTDTGLLACREKLASHSSSDEFSVFSCSPAGCNGSKRSLRVRAQTFILWLVVKGKGLCAALDTQY